MADVGAVDSGVNKETTSSTSLPHDDNSPSSSGLTDSSDQSSNNVIQSSTTPSAFSSTDQNKNGSSSVLQPSKLGGNFRPDFGISSSGNFSSSANPFAQSAGTGHGEDRSKTKEENRQRFQFRPSALGAKIDSVSNKDCVVASSNSNVSSILKPATLPDPRQNPLDTSGSDNEAQAKTVSSSDSKNTDNVENETSVISSTDPDDSTKENNATGLTESRLPNTTLRNPGFVFGENLSNRVTGVSSTNVNDEVSSPNLVFGEALSERVKNGTTSSTTEEETNEADSNSTSAAANASGNQTLAESAREYQAKQENKPDLKEVEVVTGEEEESNVLHATAKLYLFDSDNQTWIEKGQGLCRLNDMTASESDSFQSRLIMRTQGSLRVILNTPIWCGMTVERASPKSVRISAIVEEEGVKVFLIMSNPKDSENLLRAIEWRVQRLKAAEESQPKGEERGSEKRKADSTDYEAVGKKSRPDVAVESSESSTSLLREESDSSVQDPETEASCESHSSSLTIRSESE